MGLMRIPIKVVNRKSKKEAEKTLGIDSSIATDTTLREIIKESIKLAHDSGLVDEKEHNPKFFVDIRVNFGLFHKGGEYVRYK